MIKKSSKVNDLIKISGFKSAQLEQGMQNTGFTPPPTAPAMSAPDSNVENILMANDNIQIDDEVQQLVVGLNEIVKKVSIKFFNMEVSDIESLGVVKELLKDIANRVAHLPVQDVIDRLDEVLDNAEKIEKGKPTPKPGNIGTGEQAKVPQVAQAV
jgi:hypothetical protein